MTVELGICPSCLVIDPMAPTVADVRAAVAAGAAAGFTHASFWSWHLDLIAEGRGLAAACRDVQGAGLRVGTVEAATAWAGGDLGAARAEREQFSAVLAETGAGLVLAVALGAELTDPARVQANLASLVDVTIANGATICLEYLPWTAIPDLASAWELIEPLGPAAGLTLDSWHWQRQPGGPNPALLNTIPAERLTFVQLSDVSPDPLDDVLSETMSGRLLPGDGVVDFAVFLDTIGGTGAVPAVAVEVFNPALLQEVGVDEAARLMYKAARFVTGS
jgi:sugar phosphate isomerase/epimerase